MLAQSSTSPTDSTSSSSSSTTDDESSSGSSGAGSDIPTVSTFSSRHYHQRSVSRVRWNLLCSTMSSALASPSLVLALGAASPSGSGSSDPKSYLPPRPVLAQPRSRSERVLRDTLRRAEEHDRRMLPFVDPEDADRPLSDDGILSDDDELAPHHHHRGWTFRRGSRASSTSRSRRGSTEDDISRRRIESASARAPMFTRTQTAPAGPLAIPSVRVKSSIADLCTPPNSRLTPHEAMLRSRLELALRTPPQPQSSKDTLRRRTSTPPWQATDLLNVPPLTPPPSPPFDARSANTACRKMAGYVSFSAVEGLGLTDEHDANPAAVTTEKSGSWWWPWTTA